MTGPFSASAHVYDALLRHKDYAAASASLVALVQRLVPDAKTLLDVGCGTGRHLEYLGRRYHVEGVDGSPEMLEIARRRCPDARLHHGLIESFHLSKRFDVVVCLFGSIAYATDVASLRRAAHRLAEHTTPGGLVVVEPWLGPDRFVPGRLVLDSADEADLKVARIYVTARSGQVSIFDSSYVVGTPSGVTTFRERQELGLFTDLEYRDAFTDAGIRIVDSSGDLFGYGLYAGVVGDARSNG